MAGQAQTDLPQLWAAHRAFLRRLLIGLTHDVDLAEDLLQDSWLRAHQAFAGYRGGDARAWLVAVAKSAFLTHARRKRYLEERDLLEDSLPETGLTPGSDRHLEVLAARRGLAELDPGLRAALLLRHYAGFSYEEVARRTSCPVGTAKWRVNAAVTRMRQVLGGESPSAGCKAVSRLRMLDYLYGTLGEQDAGRMARHLQGCPHCRAAVADTRVVMRSLDRLQGERKMMHLIELDRRGLARLYATICERNESVEAQPKAAFYATRRFALLHWLAQGEELCYHSRRHPDEPGRVDYEALLPRPVPPRGWVEQLLVCRIPREEACAMPMEDGHLGFVWAQRPSRTEDFVFIQAIRVPNGAHLVNAWPEPRQVRQRKERTTVTWAALLAAGEHFKCAVEYAFS